MPIAPQSISQRLMARFKNRHPAATGLTTAHNEYSLKAKFTAGIAGLIFYFIGVVHDYQVYPHTRLPGKIDGRSAVT